jgi:hypothetical protein
VVAYHVVLYADPLLYTTNRTEASSVARRIPPTIGAVSASHQSSVVNRQSSVAGRQRSINFIGVPGVAC